MNDTDKQEKSEEAAWNSNVLNCQGAVEEYLLRIKTWIHSIHFFCKCIEHQDGKERKKCINVLKIRCETHSKLLQSNDSEAGSYFTVFC